MVREKFVTIFLGTVTAILVPSIFVLAFSGPSQSPPNGTGVFTFSSSSVGIGVTPTYTLDVSGTFRATGNWSLGGAAQTNLNMNGQNISGVNKLTVTSIDPLYHIGDATYATYVADTIGYKVETFGKLTLSSSSEYQVSSSKYGGGARYLIPDTVYSAAIDFNKAERGSDLWLFWQTIQEGKNMKDIGVYLTPNFPGQVWYEIDPAQEQVIIYGLPSARSAGEDLEVSYHLVAPRYDASEWPNIVPTTESGTILPMR